MINPRHLLFMPTAGTLAVSAADASRSNGSSGDASRRPDAAAASAGAARKC